MQTYDRNRAQEWMAINPTAMDLLLALAQQAVHARHRFGIKQLLEVVRWEYGVTRRNDEFKINNSSAPWIIRELLKRDPSLTPWVSLRSAAADHE